jgi:hypothetical protein
MSASFYLSLLSRQRLLLAEKFAERYPNPWLVWELGSFAADPKVKQDLLATALPPDQGLLRPQKADPVCFPIAKSSTILGRGDGCDIVVPDATVSRHHLFLRQAPEGWRVQLIAPETQVTLEGAQLKAGASYPLESGNRLNLPGVTLVFLSPAELIQRLDLLNSSQG